VLIRNELIGTIAYMGGVMALPEPFAWAWGNMLIHSHAALCQPGQYIMPDHAAQSLHDVARNQLVKRMRGDWLLMLDTDTTFESDFAARLVMIMERLNLDVVTGIYSFKRPPHFPVLYMRNRETDQHEVIRSWDGEGDVFPIDAAGGGCLLIRRRAFDAIRRELREEPFSRIDGTKGEDISFFRRLKQVGIQAHCAWKVEMVHLAYQGIRTSNDFDGSGFEAAREYNVEGLALGTLA
jgi:cellulose synthase/poly-beta-1,6-N-acetylglucosamine synthase-like glycosyltransferase